MKKTVALFIWGVFISSTIFAQSWTDQVKAALGDGLVTIELSDYNNDMKLFEKINMLRLNEDLDLEPFKFDTLGLYTKTKGAIDFHQQIESPKPQLVTSESGIVKWPRLHTIAFQNRNSFKVSNHLINELLIQGIASENMELAVKYWMGNNKRSLLHNDVAGAASAMKLLLVFQKMGENIEVKWHYMAKLTIHSRPENIARLKGE